MSSNNQPATERQIAYAQGLGLKFPADATKEELSELLTAHEEEETPATDEIRGFARLYGVSFTRCSSFDGILRRIHESLEQPDRQRELAAWYLFHVYRDLMRQERSMPITRPDDAAIVAAAAEFLTKPDAVASLRRRDTVGPRIFRFGRWVDDAGRENVGSSRETAAYKAASALLQNRLPISPPAKRSRSANTERPPRQIEQAPSGCLSVVAGLVLLASVITWQVI